MSGDDLWQRLRAGDASARDELVRRHLPLVRHLASRFAAPGLELEDLVQAGCVGLLKAIDRFDPSRGLQFSTYAVPVILGEIRRHLRDEAGAVRVSRRGQELARAARRVRARLAQELGREPTVREVAAAVGADAADVVAALEATRPPVSVFAPAGEGEDAPELVDLLAAGDEEAGYRRALVSELLQRLDPRLRRILVLRYFGDLTQGEIARDVGVSQGQVSRLERQALERLRALAAGGDVPPAMPGDGNSPSARPY